MALASGLPPSAWRFALVCPAELLRDSRLIQSVGPMNALTLDEVRRNSGHHAGPRVAVRCGSGRRSSFPPKVGGGE